jgi:hypothetical protein
MGGGRTGGTACQEETLALSGDHCVSPAAGDVAFSEAVTRQSLTAFEPIDEEAKMQRIRTLRLAAIASLGCLQGFHYHLSACQSLSAAPVFAHPSVRNSSLPFVRG